LISNKQAIKDLNFARAEFSAYARFRKNVIPIVALRRSGIHNLIEVITGRFLGDQDL
jgi:hypothetical protein